MNSGDGDSAKDTTIGKANSQQQLKEHTESINNTTNATSIPGIYLSGQIVHHTTLHYTTLHHTTPHCGLRVWVRSGLTENLVTKIHGITGDSRECGNPVGQQAGTVLKFMG